MIINEKLKKELHNLQEETGVIINNNSLTDMQIENYLKGLEKHRYILLNEVKLYNKTVGFDYEKLKTIDSEYNAELIDDILKIYVPEIMPSYKNIKTHNYKRILLHRAEITKPFKNLFEDQVFIYIKVFDNILGWDIDNKCIKPIADALILSQVIKDDNTSKMFYAAKGEFSENPHTEIFVIHGDKITEFLENYSR